MKDFTLKIYEKLLIALKLANYEFVTFEGFINLSFPRRRESTENEDIAGDSRLRWNDTLRFIILRHDVDLKAENSLETAKIEHSLGIRASYYFRIVPQSDKPHIIKQIAALGHEIGYHYEDLSLFKGDETQAIAHFETQLAHFRKFYPVRTICMHGSPTSKIDNKDIWKSYNYRNFGIIGEPYFDVDFNKVFYLTDTGRSWNGARFSVRDKVKSTFDLHFRTTFEIINALKNNELPDKIMITTHPQRWTDNNFQWTKELVFQSLKNLIKLFLAHR
ncbi:MAG: hypothetical protein LBN95_06605 [Prevotellaceae bacterium]|jgi:hypothetical protein|nr:hypothetical protein [Prevotellaceae bacterium]